MPKGQPMTEAEWLACKDPTDLLVFEEHRSADRKLRLFACACVYRIWDCFWHERCRAAVRVGERLADGGVDEEERKVALQAVQDAYREASPLPLSPTEDAILAARYTLVGSALLGFAAANRAASSRTTSKTTEQAAQATLFRDIFGNPFRPVSLDPSWLTSTVTALAREMYESRDFTAMPILADALQDIGCDNEEVLNHCRRADPHVRGCWVVDLVLGKG